MLKLEVVTFRRQTPFSRFKNIGENYSKFEKNPAQIFKKFERKTAKDLFLLFLQLQAVKALNGMTFKFR
jgi:hypothetical protein